MCLFFLSFFFYLKPFGLGRGGPGPHGAGRGLPNLTRCRYVRGGLGPFKTRLTRHVDIPNFMGRENVLKIFSKIIFPYLHVAGS